jgi:hypothetical protein
MRVSAGTEAIPDAEIRHHGLLQERRLRRVRELTRALAAAEDETDGMDAAARTALIAQLNADWHSQWQGLISEGAELESIFQEILAGPTDEDLALQRAVVMHCDVACETHAWEATSEESARPSTDWLLKKRELEGNHIRAWARLRRLESSRGRARHPDTANTDLSMLLFLIEVEQQVWQAALPARRPPQVVPEGPTPIAPPPRLRSFFFTTVCRREARQHRVG